MNAPQPNFNNEVRELIGEEKYIQLMKLHGGNSFYITKYESYERDKRNQHIKELSKKGLTNRQLSERFNTSIQHIRNIIKN